MLSHHVLLPFTTVQELAIKLEVTLGNGEARYRGVMEDSSECDKLIAGDEADRNRSSAFVFYQKSSAFFCTSLTRLIFSWLCFWDKQVHLQYQSRGYFSKSGNQTDYPSFGHSILQREVLVRTDIESMLCTAYDLF